MTNRSVLLHKQLCEVLNHKPKTLFLFSPEKGFVKLEQKLPMPWHAFNETPNFQEIAEYKRLSTLQSWFNPSNSSSTIWWQAYHAYLPLLDSTNWLPPFRGESLLLLIGQQVRAVTFNGRGLSLGGRGLCAAHALLAADFVDRDFQLVLATLADSRRQLIVMAGGSTVTVDMTRQTVSVIGGAGTSGGGRRLPIDVGSLAVVQERGVATVTGRRGFQLRCTFQHGVCVFTLEGWYFGKTAGLLGTMDSERSNDLTTAEGHVTADWRQFVDSWRLGVGEPCHGAPPAQLGNTAAQATPGQRQAKCAALFASKVGNTKIAILAILKSLCFQGTELSEADAPVELQGGSVPQSSDVVLVVEAGACTRALNGRKQLQQLAAALDDELTRVQLVRNRFAVVSFGGVGVYAEPRLLTVDGMDFTTARLLHEHLAHLPSESGPRADVLDALRYTFGLQWRAGVSRTLVVALCSDCSPHNSTLDFSTLRQMMADRAARAVKTLYGLDAEKAYTKNDFKQLQGDADLRKQIKLTKTTLGNCLPLAIETNGTLFTARKLDTSAAAGGGGANAQQVRKFLNVFARRIAQTARPPACQRCECVSGGGGAGAMGVASFSGGGMLGSGGGMSVPSFDCYSCAMPSPFSAATPSFQSTFGFRNNFTEAFLQSVTSDGEDMDFEDGI
ncbi:hypothetical protein LSTR_LSTR014453 [Laodelphax striatellus]|uniref:VWFD domain-containing protein n=1 Tax=Laodelphax striatellus TaxID=195883 RepID=A0A482X5G8_LAOST|nr:hypothetical protein LSTR_LSTR014453 [Laodelphax striatellus]